MYGAMLRFFRCVLIAWHANRIVRNHPLGDEKVTAEGRTFNKKVTTNFAPETVFRIAANKQQFFDSLQECVPTINISANKGKPLRNLLFRIRPWEWRYIFTIMSLVFMNSKELSIVSAVRQKVVYVVPVAFYIFGCPRSTDIDVAVQVKTRADLKKSINEDWLRDELRDLGYDTTRGIDYNLVYVENSMIVDVSKGSPKDTQMIIFLTHKNHAQKHRIPFTTYHPTDMHDRIRALAKFFLDHMKDLVGEERYNELREERKEIYSGGWKRIVFAMEHLDEIQVRTDAKSRDAIKSIVMKMIQLILQTRGVFECTKHGLAEKIGGIYLGREGHALYHLFRGNDGEYSEDFLPILISAVKEIVEESHTNIEWRNFDLPWDKNPMPETLPDNIFREFMKSPLKATKKIITMFKEFCPSGSINSCFPIISSGCEYLPQRLRNDHVFECDQRSDEWKKLQKRHPNGSSSSIVLDISGDWVSEHYNLIRGSIIEQIVMVFFHLEGYHNVTVGMMVPSKETIGSRNCSPDLLLTNGVETIPVEIKCLPNKPTDNHGYRRAVNLARHQLSSAAEIIGCNQGILVFVYVYEKDGDVVFECRYAYVSL